MQRIVSQKDPSKAAIGEFDELLTMVKKRRLRRFGHVSRPYGLAGHSEKKKQNRET